jgi:hypothetical protein
LENIHNNCVLTVRMWRYKIVKKIILTFNYYILHTMSVSLLTFQIILLSFFQIGKSCKKEDEWSFTR